VTTWTRRKARRQRVKLNALSRRMRTTGLRWATCFKTAFDLEVCRLEESHLFYMESLYYCGGAL
jgi:hypothetical protein